MKEYLPSKQFIARLAILAIIIGLVFSIYKLVIFIKNKVHQKNQPKPLVIKDIVQRDTNDNGIPDWEESLWGLDPTKDGPSNKEFILAKKQTLIKTGDISSIDDSAAISENENLSREFFAVIMSLQQSGNLDENSIQAVSEAIGQKIVADPIPDIYMKEMVTTRLVSQATTDAYYNALKDLFVKYQSKDIGNELTYVAQALKNNDTHATTLISQIATAYKAFGKELIKVPVPNNLVAKHVELANNYEKTGKSLDGLAKILEDPLTGMKAIINYNKYSDALAANIQYLSDNR